MPELNFKITADDEDVKKKLSNIAKYSKDVNDQVAKEVNKGIDTEVKSRNKAVKATQDQKKASDDVVKSVNEEAKAQDRVTDAIKRKQGAFDRVTGLQTRPIQMTSSLDEVNASNVSRVGTVPSGTVVGTSEAFNKAANEAKAFGNATAEANKIATTTTNETTEAIKRAMTARNVLESRIQSYRNITGSTTDPSIYAEYTKKIQETQAEMAKLGNVGKRGYDELGNRIKSTVGQQEILTTRLKYFQDQLNYAKAPQSFVALNRKIEETTEQINRLQNAGKKGFDELGNKIKEVDSTAGKFVNTLKSIGAAILAAFSIQMIISWAKEARELAARGEGIREAFSKLGNEKTLENLRIATRGATSDIDLMAAALRAKNFQIAPELLAKGLELAGKVSRQTGQDVTYLTDSFVNGLGRKSLLILDNLQISQVQLRAEIKKTGDFQTAVGNVVEAKLKSMGEVSMTTADKMAQFATRIANIKELVGQKINMVINYDALKEANREFYESGISVQNLQRNIAPLLTKYDELSAKAEKNGGVTKLNKVEQTLMKDIIKQVAEEIPGAITQFDKYGNAIAISTTRAKEFIEQQVLMLQALNEDRIKKTTDRLADLKEELRGLKAPMDDIAKSGTFDVSTRVSSENGTRTVTRKATEDEKKEVIKRYQEVSKTIAQQEALRAADSGELLKKRQAEIDKFQKITKTDDGKEEAKLNKARERQEAADAAALSAQESLQQRIQVLKDKFERQGLTKEEEARRAIIDEFKKLAFDIEQQGKRYDAYAKKYGAARANSVLGPKQTTEQIEPIRKAAIDDLTFRQDTAKLQIELDKQRVLYENFENDKKAFGETAANQKYDKDLRVYKTYLDRLEAERAKVLDKDPTQMTGPEKEKLEYLNAQIDQQVKIQNDAYRDLLLANSTYEQQKAAVTDRYNAAFAKLEGDSNVGRRAVLTKGYQDELKQLSEAMLRKSEVYKNAAEEALILTREQTIKQIAALEKLFDAGLIPNDQVAKVRKELDRLKFTLKIGVDQGNLNSLKDEFSRVAAELHAKDDDGNDIILSKDDSKAIIARLAEIQIKIDEVTNPNSGKSKSGFAKGLEENFKYLKGSATEVAAGVSTDLGRLSSGFNELSGALGGVDTKAGYALDTIGKLAQAGSDAAGAFASFSQGDIIGGITKTISAVTSVLSIGKKVKEMNAAARQEVEDFYKNAIAGEREYQDLLKERELQTIRNNKIALQGIRDELSLRKSQNDDYAKEAAEIMASLQGQSFVASESYKHGTWFRKAEVNKTYGSLQGKSFAELSQLLAQGKLEGDTKALVERLSELEQKGYDAEQAIADLAKETSELFTGTTSDNLTNTLADMFANGKTSAQDLADFFKQSMDDAALSIFKNKVLAGAMESFYAEFDKAAQSDDQLTSDEIARLNGLFTSLTGDALKKFEDFKKITGSDLLGPASDSNSTSGIQGQITAAGLTAEAGNELKGIWRGQYDVTKVLGTTAKDLLQNNIAQLNSLIAIERYTGATADNTAVLGGMAADIKRLAEASGSSGGIDQLLRNTGVKP